MPTSAWELAKHLSEKAAKNDIQDHGTNWPGLAAVLRPRCYLCKREVEETKETVDHDGTHIIQVRCHGMKDMMRITRVELEELMRSNTKISAGVAFFNTNMIEKNKTKGLITDKENS